MSEDGYSPSSDKSSLEEKLDRAKRRLEPRVFWSQSLVRSSDDTASDDDRFIFDPKAERASKDLDTEHDLAWSEQDRLAQEELVYGTKDPEDYKYLTQLKVHEDYLVWSEKDRLAQEEHLDAKLGDTRDPKSYKALTKLNIAGLKPIPCPTLDTYNVQNNSLLHLLARKGLYGACLRVTRENGASRVITNRKGELLVDLVPTILDDLEYLRLYNLLRPEAPSGTKESFEIVRVTEPIGKIGEWDFSVTKTKTRSRY